MAFFCTASHLRALARALVKAGAVLALSWSAPALTQDSLPAGVAHLPTLLAAPCAGLTVYEPLPVFDFAGGVRIGQLVLDRPEWATRPQRPTGQPCLQEVRLQVQLSGKEEGMDVPVLSLSGEPVLLIAQTQVSAGTLWLMVQTNNRRFWLPQRQGVLFRSLERDLVQGLGAVQETCNELGECRPTDTAFRRLVDEAALLQSPNCPLPAYEVVERRQLPTGRWVYEAELAPALQGRYAGRLPLTVRVPVRDFAGHWSGFFNANPCPKPGQLPSPSGDPDKAEAHSSARPQADWRGFDEGDSSGEVPLAPVFDAPNAASTAPGPVRMLNHLPPLHPAGGAGASPPTHPSFTSPTVPQTTPRALPGTAPLEFAAPPR